MGTTKPLYFSKSEVLRHNHKDSCWLFSKNKVYDVTPYINEHPNGLKIFLSKSGKDVYNDFLFHSKKNRKVWKKFFIGYLSCQD